MESFEVMAQIIIVTLLMTSLFVGPSSDKCNGIRLLAVVRNLLLIKHIK